MDNQVDQSTGGIMFRTHTVESAPAASRPLMEATIAQFGQLAEPIARLAESPEMLDGFLHASHLFEATGEVPDEEIEEFLAAGYTTRNALEVMLGIGTYTMATFANRLIRA
jgi:hypothetical protein